MAYCKTILNVINADLEVLSLRHITKRLIKVRIIFMLDKTLFERINDREIPADIVYEDEVCFAIKDINPQAPIHILLIPIKPIKKLSECEEVDKDILAHLFITVGKIAEKLGIPDNFRVNINNGKEAGQEVFHLHIHILGGRKFSWPPG